MYFSKNTLKKYDLQESYNNFKIKCIVSFCESGPCMAVTTSPKKAIEQYKIKYKWYFIGTVITGLKKL